MKRQLTPSTPTFAVPLAVLLTAGAVLSGCIVQSPPPRPVYREYVPPPPPPQYVPPPPPPPAPPPQYFPPPPPPDAGYAPPPDADYAPPPEALADAPQAVVSVYVDPPMVQPEPIGVPWAPPPMLVEDPGPPPFYGAYWTGGYWVWEGDWVWAHGRWLGAPAPGYFWNHPYYENRDGIVIFIPGFWRAPNAVFVAPVFGVAVVMVAARPGVVAGPRCEGPNGVFVPAPPGSRRGVIVAAPIGTSPAVVVGAPPVRQPGMRVRPGENGNFHVEAPPSSTFTGRPFAGVAPGQAHLAAAQAPVVRVAAPAPASSTPIRSFAPRQGYTALPPPRPVERPVVRPFARPSDRQAERPPLAPPPPAGQAPAPPRPPVAQPPIARPPLPQPAPPPQFQPAPPRPQGLPQPGSARPPGAPQAGAPQGQPGVPQQGQAPGQVRPQAAPPAPPPRPAPKPAPREEEREHERERR